MAVGMDVCPHCFSGRKTMMLRAKKPPSSPINLFIKRSMDIIIASIALLLFAPIIIICIILLKLEGQSGSIFYNGKRIGKNARKFHCWKIRTMKPNSDYLLYDLLKKDHKARSEWEIYRKLKIPDPRVTTKTARFIRKTSIDELPQLWNVLKGDMSIVGPRPILENEVALFGNSIAEYILIKPGITGLWQVSGRNNTSFEHRIYWDGCYAQNWSLWNDIVIILRTFPVVINKSGAY